MKTVLLYPLNFPITPDTGFYYFESPSPNSNNSNLQDLFQKFYIYIDTNIPITNNEYILMNLKLHRKLGSNNNHPYPHIDLELPNRKQEKRVFDMQPSDYEASINSGIKIRRVLQ
jgi:hypothetical protein